MAKTIRITNLLANPISVGPYRIIKGGYKEDDLATVQANSQTMADILEYLNDSYISVTIDGVAAGYNEMDNSLYVPTADFNLAGSIAAAADFPTALAVTKGDVYMITADVTDDDASKTNTGLSFPANGEIVWNGTTWTPFGDQEGFKSVAATPYTVLDSDGVILVDTVTIGAPSVVNLPTAVDKAGKRITVQDSTGGAAANAIAVTPDGTEEINGVNAPVSIATNFGQVALISDGANWLNAAAGGSAAIAANTAHRTGDGSDHADVATNTTHSTGDGSDHANVATNDTHVAGDGSDHADVAANSADIATIMPKLVQVVITATGGVGGATAGTISVQVNDLDGNPVTRAVKIALDSSLTQFAGPLAATGTAFFGAATTGTLNIGSGALSAVVTTDATGLYEGALADAADETAWFSARTVPGGAAALTEGCVVAECVADDATWTA